MKKYSSLVLFLFLLFSISFLNFSAFATTDLDIVITVSHYEGGSDITCHGVNDGVMEAVIVGGTAPYSFQWTNGAFTAFTKKISGLAPGEYIFTVIDANSDTVSKSAKIHDITAISTNPELSDYSGYNISYQGGDDGDIHLGTSGGVSPYSFLWSTTQQEENISGLSSGNYTVSITDANACVLTQTFTMTEPTPLHVLSIISPLHHGYNISCNGGDDGSIALSVAGGVSPYTYLWNSGDTTQNMHTLKAGTFTVQIHDANNVLITRSITLSQPEPLLFDLAATVYGNGKNTTCYNCSDGYVSSNANGGVAPYTYAWKTGQTTASLSGVIARNYSLEVTDQNGCHKSSAITLTQPDRDDWTMLGNSGSNADSNFIGTKDSTSFTIKTNGMNRIKIHSEGLIQFYNGLKLVSSPVDSFNTVYVDQDGKLRISTYGTSISPPGCLLPSNSWFRDICQNPNNGNIYKYPLYGNIGVGTTDPRSKIESVGSIRMTKSGDPSSYLILEHDGYDTKIDNYTGGKLIINTNPNSGYALTTNGGIVLRNNGIISIGVSSSTFLNSSDGFKLYVVGGIRTEKVKVDVASTNNWADYVFSENYNLKSLDEIKNYIFEYGHLPGIPSANDVVKSGVDLLEMQSKLLEKIEELTLYVIQLKEENLKMQNRLIDK